MNMFVKCLIVSLVFTLLFFLVHMAAMQVPGTMAMTSHLSLGLQAMVAGLLFCLACKFVPPLKDCCCSM